MSFKNFRFQIIIRVIGIGLAMVGLAWSLYETDFLMTPIVFGLLAIIQMFALIYYGEWTIRELKRFFESFIDSDYTRRFEKSEKGKPFQQLEAAFNNIVEDFRKIRIEKEEHYQYLLQVNKHVNVGLICFTADGNIDLMNTAACQLLNKPLLTRMEMLANYNADFYDQITALDSGEKALYKGDFGQGAIDLAIAAHQFKLGEQEYTLLSLQNIRSELDAQEMQAWQKLIRVLTHEIMNSVTPVVSLTTAVKKIMEDETGYPVAVSTLEEEQGEDIYKSINAIENRGQGLLEFVNAYRDYTKIPSPELEKTDLIALVNNVLVVLKGSLEHIEVQVKADESKVFCQIDGKLIDQVLINILKNATEALEGNEHPRIIINIQSSDGPRISIANNGPGIPTEIREEIFVPFYTTKPKGNGIGLSLSKQIMKAHGGDIDSETGPNGTVFKLRF